MDKLDLLPLIAAATDALTLAFAGFAALVIRRMRPDLGIGRTAFILLPVLVWALVWVHLPALAAFRRNGAAALAASIAGPLIWFALTLVRSARPGSSAAMHRAALTLAPWRVLFGALILWTGALGGLPRGFFVSAGLGDIAVGVWGGLLLRRATIGPDALRMWSYAGLADLVHVLALGAIFLPPFFRNHPALPLVGLLPISGVPLFIASHLMTLRQLHPAVRPA